MIVVYMCFREITEPSPDYTKPIPYAIQLIPIRETQKLKLLLDNLQIEHDRLKVDEQTKSTKLSEMLLHAERREQAKSDLNGLEETVVSSRSSRGH